MCRLLLLRERYRDGCNLRPRCTEIYPWYVRTYAHIAASAFACMIGTTASAQRSAVQCIVLYCIVVQLLIFRKGEKKIKQKPRQLSFSALFPDILPPSLPSHSSLLFRSILYSSRLLSLVVHYLSPTRPILLTHNMLLCAFPSLFLLPFPLLPLSSHLLDLYYPI